MPIRMDLLCVSVSQPEIDAVHRELAELVAKIDDTADKDFSPLYASLIQHTESHFSREEQLMRESGFIHIAEHLDEHKQMLQEMRQFGKRPLPLARAYVRERLPERFSLHITRMDSLLAAYLRECE